MAPPTWVEVMKRGRTSQANVVHIWSGTLLFAGLEALVICCEATATILCLEIGERI